MIKRPLAPQFSDKVIAGIKFTTIREKAWPVGKPIMLYNWSGKPYRSKHVDVCPIVVIGFWSIEITHQKDGTMQYSYGMEHAKPIHETEGFDSREDMDNWFRSRVKPGKSITETLMRFRLWKGDVE